MKQSENQPNENTWHLDECQGQSSPDNVWFVTSAVGYVGDCGDVVVQECGAVSLFKIMEPIEEI